MMTQVMDWMERGGPVMWPLMGLSLVGLALTIERSWFWLRTHTGAAMERMRQLNAHLRRGEWEQANVLATRGGGLYGQLALSLTRSLTADQSTAGHEAAAVEAVQTHRTAMERFMPTLSTIITAAPMLGILGTVTGIIKSFGLLASTEQAVDPQAVSAGIAEALLTTAVGLMVALGVLFPYNAFRGQIDRALSRAETLCASALAGGGLAGGAMAGCEHRPREISDRAGN